MTNIPNTDDSPKPFVEHLEELRWRLIKGIAAVAITSFVSFYYTDPILNYLSKPVGRFIFLHPTGAFLARLKVSSICGVILSFPFLLYQAWKFVMVALQPKEKKAIFWLIPCSYILFLFGFLMGFFFLVPRGVQFLMSYSSAVLVPQISIEEYLNFVGIICLAFGLIFQMPLLSFLITKFGLIQSDTLISKRKMMILVFYLLGVLLSPSPDPITHILLALTSYILFECSIFTAKIAEK